MTEHRSTGTAEAGDLLEVEGIGVPWDQTGVIPGGLLESFRRGSVDPQSVIGLQVGFGHEEATGVVLDAQDLPQGLWLRTRMDDTPLGRAAWRMAKDKALRWSIGFDTVPGGDVQHGRRVERTRVDPIEFSLTHKPTYTGAVVTAVRHRQGDPMPTDTEAPPAEQIRETDLPPLAAGDALREIAELRDQLAALAARPAPPDPSGIHPLSQYRSLGEAFQAGLAGAEHSRVVASNVLADAPGLLPPTWLTELRGVVDLGRRFITALGGPTALPATGMDVNWPYTDTDLSALVAKQATESTDLASAKVPIKKGASSIDTYGFTGEMSYQLLQRTDPAYLTQWLRLVFLSYAVVTDRVAVAAAETAGTGTGSYSGADVSTLYGAVVEAAAKVEDATGLPPAMIAVKDSEWKSIAGALGSDKRPLFPPYGPTNAAGQTTRPGGLQLDIAGIPAIRVKGLTAAAVVTNGAAFGWGESGPSTVDQEIASTLSRDVAVYGYAAPMAWVPTGIVKVTKGA